LLLEQHDTVVCVHIILHWLEVQ